MASLGTVLGMTSGIASSTSAVVSWADIEAMTNAEFKVFENRLRRVAFRQGYRLEKSRRRDERAITFGLYRLVDMFNREVVGAGPITDGPGGYGLDAVDLAAKLYGDADDTITSVQAG